MPAPALDADFRKLWVGQTVSVFGSLITRVALPLLAILTLDATPLQVALLQIADGAPPLLAGPLVGVWADRLRRRPLLIAADVGRALLLGSIPVAAWLQWLSMPLLYLVACCASLLTVLFEVAYQAYLPTLAPREALVEGNSKLVASASVAEFAGFGLSGLLVQTLTAPFAILLDALTFLASAATLGLIRKPEQAPSHPPGTVRSARLELRAGVGVVGRDRLLRPLALAAVADLFFTHVWVAVLMLFLVRTLQLQPGPIGIVFGVGGLASLGGALATRSVARRLGSGGAMLGGLLVYRLGAFLVALATGPASLILLLLAGQQATDGAYTVFHITRLSLIQRLVPDQLLGRVSATFHVLERGAMLAGLFTGGLLGNWLGPRATLFVGAIGALSGVAILYRSPVRRLRELPPMLSAGASITLRE